MRHAGLIVLVDFDFAAWVRLQSGGFDAKLIAIGLASDGVE